MRLVVIMCGLLLLPSQVLSQMGSSMEMGDTTRLELQEKLLTHLSVERG